MVHASNIHTLSPTCGWQIAFIPVKSASFFPWDSFFHQSVIVEYFSILATGKTFFFPQMLITFFLLILKKVYKNCRLLTGNIYESIFRLKNASLKRTPSNSPPLPIIFLLHPSMSLFITCTKLLANLQTSLLL